MALFGRTYRLVVGQPGAAGVELLHGANKQGLRITFEIEKTATPRPNRSKVTIYNLAPTTRAMLEKPDTKCILSAGYELDAGPLPLFSGDVEFAYTERRGADYLTILELHDGHVALRDTMATISGNSAHAVIKSAASQLGLPLVMDSGIPDREWNHGFSYYGPARNALRRATAAAGLEWSVQNGKLQVLAAGGTTLRQAVVLGGESGLIGPPERTRRGQEQAGLISDLTRNTPVKPIIAAQRRKYDGWRVRSLLVASINPGDPVVLDSLTVTGQFRAETVRHNGDSHGGDWQTDMELLTPSDYAAKAAADAVRAQKKAIALTKAPRAPKGL